MEVKLYVGNLSSTTTEDNLRTLFAQAGQVASVDLVKDRETGNFKGFAFVEMRTRAEAQKAISLLNGFNLEERELKVNPAKPRAARSKAGAIAGDRAGLRRLLCNSK
ncbi:MAG: RNA-binding protein [Anaerolineales bacterium]|nr:RNA-binding protein [Anaerolineales bacterium]